MLTSLTAGTREILRVFPKMLIPRNTSAVPRLAFGGSQDSRPDRVRIGQRCSSPGTPFSTCLTHQCCRICAYAHIFERLQNHCEPPAVAASTCQPVACVVALGGFSDSMSSPAFIKKSLKALRHKGIGRTDVDALLCASASKCSHHRSA